MHSHELLTTFTIAAALGVCLFTVARYLRTSAIVVLLLGGVLAGPSGLGIVDPEVLGDGLSTIISLAVAIILFEGGLTLDLKGYRTVSKEIWRILTIGLLVTWMGSACLLRLAFGFEWAFCVLAASLIIVTGPTVIGPMLHRTRVKGKLHHILHWEGVLIDPIGVFIALMCFEYFVSTGGTHHWVLQDLFMRFAVGASLGVAFGFALDRVLRHDWIDDGHVNIFVLAMAMLNFCLADLAISESGLLSVTIAGLVLGSRNTPQLRKIVSYKVELKDFLIGLLFVLLAANLDFHAFLDYGWKLVAVVAAIMLVIRPLNVFASMRGSSLSRNEKLFLSWVAPRGIVAASMASVFALKLSAAGVANGAFIEAFTYSVIVGTVVVQGFTVGIVGHLLGVVRSEPKGWMIVGAHAVGRQVAHFLTRQGIDVVLVDTNAGEVRTAQREGLVALSEDAMQLNPEAHVELYGCGNLLALTANPDLNRMLCRRYAETFDGSVPHRWEKTGYETAGNEHLLMGSRVWSELPLHRWMQPSSDVPPLHIRTEQSPSKTSEKIMMSVHGDVMFSQSRTNSEGENAEWLVYDSEVGQQSLSLPIQRENVIFTQQVELRSLYRSMLDHLHRQLPQINPTELLDEMWGREAEYTSLLGNGIALPHAWNDRVDESALMVARLTNEASCPQTGRPIEIVFMLLSPTGQPNQHLERLSCIARMIGSQSQRQLIIDAESPEQLHQILALS